MSARDVDTAPFCGDIEALTRANTYFRRVLHTTPQQQLVVMSLEPGQDIPTERHAGVTQLVRVESGRGLVVVNGHTMHVEDGMLVVVPPGAAHRVVNLASATEPLQLYSVYSPPEHARGTVHRRRRDDPDIAAAAHDSRAPTTGW